MLQPQRQSAMKWILISRLVVMVIALLGVFWTIQRLQTQGIPTEVSQVMGIDKTQINSGGRVAKVLLAKRLTWCESRVTQIESPTPYRIFQEGRKWKVQDQSQVREVSFIEVEKWFGNHCSVGIVPVENSRDSVQKSSETWAKIFTITFVNGNAEPLKQATTGLFEWKGQHFRSPELEKALSDLVSF